MASQTDLNALEKDVELARARLAGDLARLRDPKTVTTARDELTSTVSAYRDDALNRARRTASSTSRTLIDEARLRVENNPIAALIMGAGVAWKVLRDPPIASLLFLGGLASLINTKPDETRSQTPATDAILATRDRVVASARQTSAVVQDYGRQVADRATEVANKASALAHEARGQLAEAADVAASQASAVAERASDYGARAADAATRVNQAARERYQANPMLMGAAALAFGAALGLATRRRPAPARRATG